LNFGEILAVNNKEEQKISCECVGLLILEAITKNRYNLKGHNAKRHKTGWHNAKRHYVTFKGFKVIEAVAPKSLKGR